MKINIKSKIKVITVLVYSCFLFSGYGTAEEFEIDYRNPSLQQFFSFLAERGVGEITEDDIETGMRKTAHDTWYIKRTLLLKAALHCQDIFSQVTIQRVLDHEKVFGYYVKHVVNKSLPEKLGFEKGDIIVSLNDTEVDTFLEYENLDELVLSETEIRVKIDRKGTIVIQKYIII